MAVFELFSKRQSALRGEVPDVFQYAEIPHPLRVQIVHIWLDALGRPEDFFDSYGGYKPIVEALRREYGVFILPGGGAHRGDYIGELIDFFMAEPNVERVVDAVELSFRVIDRVTRNWDYLYRENASDLADDAISEVNARFKEHGVGYHYADGEVIRVDSELMHTEVVMPALRLLNGNIYQGAQEEFLAAHDHYRAGKAKEALNDCLKAFESTMKAICEKRKWAYSKSASAKDLVTICFEKGLIPSFWQTSFGALRALLESSVPTGRNKLSGHGQGSTVTPVPDHIVGYVLHMTAAAIVFLAEAERSLR